jgi:hypothetical protein
MQIWTLLDEKRHELQCFLLVWWTSVDVLGRGSGAQRGFEPLTRALRNRRSLPRLILINKLRTPIAVSAREKQRKSACAGTKLAAVNSAVRENPSLHDVASIGTSMMRILPVMLARADLVTRPSLRQVRCLPLTPKRDSVASEVPSGGRWKALKLVSLWHEDVASA